MKAVILTQYGPPSLLQIQEIPVPTPKEHEVLIKVKATAVNDYDWSMVRGKPYVYRLLFGLFKPKRKIPGMELSGVVDSVGAKVKSFKTGDEVYGDISDYGFGSFAEYLCIDEKAVVLKPQMMSFVDAAAIPHASLLAYQGLIEVADLQRGQNILINGAGGGVGTFGAQIAKWFDAQVTGVDTGNKLEMMKSVGFDYVIDYKQLDFTQNGKQYDLILDAKTNRSPLAYARTLNSNGIYVTVGGSLIRLLQLLIMGPLISRLTKKRFRILALKPNKYLDRIGSLYEEGKLKCIIDGPHPLSETSNVLQHFGEAKHQGKVIITI